MNKKLKQFINKLKNVRLEDSEKEHLRTNVLNFVKENPVRKPIDERLILQRTIFPFNLNLKKMPIIPAILALSLLTGGVSFAAEQSLPGDFLYPMKVSVNEKVRSDFALTPEARANWEVKVVERRLEEVETLVAEGRLFIELVPTIEKRIKKQTERVYSHIGKLEEKGKVSAIDVSSKLEAVIDVHEGVLSNLSEEVKEIKILLPIIQQEGKFIDGVTERLINKIDKHEISVSKETVEKKLEIIKKDIVEIRNLVEKDKKDLSEENIKKIEEILLEADRLVIKSVGYFNIKNYSDAFITLKKAQDLIQRTRMFFKIKLSDFIPLGIFIDIPITNNDLPKKDDDKKLPTIEIDIDLPLKPIDNDSFRPQSLSYEIQKGGVLIKWDSPKEKGEITGYMIATSGWGGFVWKDVARVSQTSYLLDVSDTCFLKIRITPIDKDGELLTYSSAHLNNIDSGGECGPIPVLPPITIQ
jgi:hypothetical protein